MGYQSKTYSLSDEVVAVIEEQKTSGISPDKFLWSLIFRRKKPSKREQAVAQLRASDPMAAERPDVEYGSDELPSGGSVMLDAVAPPIGRGKASVESWRRPPRQRGDKTR